MLMSPDPAPEPDDRGPVDSDDPLVSRLRALDWPSVDEKTRERALERFREIVRERELEDGAGT
jgi:hypothetical protein